VSAVASPWDGALPGVVPALVRAAGALCWRRTPGGLEVLTVHRPKYHDWSWPKGKLEAGEPPVAAAVREVAEETGLAITLGQALPSARYPLGPDLTKHVFYWTAHVPDGGHPQPPRPHEVDRTEWMSPQEADRRLTRRADRVQLRALLDVERAGTLDTWPLVVVRTADPDGCGPPPEGAVPPGVAELAKSLPVLLTGWCPQRVVTSPDEACLASVMPYVEETGARLRTKNRLTDAGHRRDPAKVARLVAGLLSKGRPTLLCTQRAALTTVLGTLAGSAAVGVGEAIPRQDLLAPGECLVAHVATGSGRVVAVERHHPLPSATG
jgi:8-oxo-dGTP pyrophosphatase MutT (NUDIX family)